MSQSNYVPESGVFTRSSSFKLVPTDQAYDFTFGDSRGPNGYKLSNAGDVVPEILTAR
jgi:hypothetical protein